MTMSNAAMFVAGVIVGMMWYAMYDAFYGEHYDE
jgi:hypothetical protein